MIWSDSLARTARDHALDIGLCGITGHTGTDGSAFWHRTKRYSSYSGAAENIPFGDYDDTEGPEAVKQLIVDDGNGPLWGHRVNIYNREYTHVGISCACHSFYRNTCLFNYAKEPYESKKGRIANKRPAIANDNQSCKDSSVNSHPASDSVKPAADATTY